MKVTYVSWITQSIGGVINRFSQDVMIIDTQLANAFINTAMQVCTSIASTVLLIVATPYIGIAVPFLCAIFWVIQHVYLRTSKQLRTLDLEAKAPLCAHFWQSASGLASIKAFGWTEDYREMNIQLLRRAGCVFCKQRRIKCDQNRPNCLNCHKRGRACQYEISKPVFEFRDFRRMTPSPERIPNAIVVTEELRRSVEYFCVKGLPILRRCQPSPLWDYLVAQLLDAGPSVRYIAAAMGVQQRILVQGDAAVDRNTDLQDQAYRLYAGAISSFRRSIEEICESRELQIPLGCLLMVILESTRGSPDHLLIHSRCGLSIPHNRTGDAAREFREVSKLLRQYAVNATVFNPTSAIAQAVQVLLAALPTDDIHLDPVAQVSQLVSNLSRALSEVISPALANLKVAVSLTPFDLINRLSKQQQYAEQVIDSCLAACANGRNSSTYGFAKARCIMVKIYLMCAWTGWQTDYDAAVDLFRKVVDIEEKSLMMLCANTGDEEYSNARAAFSVGLSAQVTLMQVIHQCRDTDTRFRALKLVAQCPRFEGVYDTALSVAICRAMIEFEGLSCHFADGIIPEHLRIHHYNLITESEGLDDWTGVRFYCRDIDSNNFVTHDVRLRIV